LHKAELIFSGLRGFILKKLMTAAGSGMRISILLLAVILCGCSSPSRDMTGFWGGAYDITANVTKVELQLKQDGAKLSGEYSAFEPATMSGFAGAVEGRISGNEVFLTFKVDQETKGKKRLSDLEFKGVVKEEEGQVIINGWTTSNYEGSKKVMETLFTKESQTGE